MSETFPVIVRSELTSLPRACASQGRMCSHYCTCCHTEMEVTYQTLYLTQPQYTDTVPTSPRTDPVSLDAWQSSHRSITFVTWPGKIPTEKDGTELGGRHSRSGHLSHYANDAVWYSGTRARMHHKVVGNFGSEADVPSLYYRRFRFNDTLDVGACTHGRPAK